MSYGPDAVADRRPPQKHIDQCRHHQGEDCTQVDSGLGNDARQPGPCWQCLRLGKAGAIGDLEHWPPGFPCETRVEGDAGVRVIFQVVVYWIGVFFQVIMLN